MSSTLLKNVELKEIFGSASRNLSVYQTNSFRNLTDKILRKFQLK